MGTRILVAAWVLLAALVVSWLILVLLGSWGILSDSYWLPLAIFLAVISLVALVASVTPITSSEPRDRNPGRRKILYWALGMTILATIPFLSSFASTALAGALGCSVNEHSAKGCVLGGWDLNSLIHGLHLFIFAVVFTWPAALVALVLWGKIALGIPDRK